MPKLLASIKNTRHSKAICHKVKSDNSGADRKIYPDCKIHAHNWVNDDDNVNSHNNVEFLHNRM